MKTKPLSSLFPAVLLASALLCARPAAGADNTTLTKVGDKSPVTAIQTTDAQTVELKGKVVLLNFFATWCGPCNTEMPRLEKEIWQPFKDKGLVVISLGREHSAAEVEKFKTEKGLTFKFAADPKREVFSKFATQSIPRNVLVGKDGTIKFQSIGFEEKEFASLVAAVKAELGR